MLKSMTTQLDQSQKLRSKLWRDTHQEHLAKYRVEHLEEHRAWNRSHSAYYTEKRKGWRERVGKHNSEYVQKWYAEHPKIKKVNTLMIQLRDEAPLAEFCEVCPPDDLREAVQRHHPDYDFPLIYVSCCVACHAHMNRERTSSEERSKIK